MGSCLCVRAGDRIGVQGMLYRCGIGVCIQVYICVCVPVARMQHKVVAVQYHVGVPPAECVIVFQIICSSS